jgi:hypothetical protein
MHHEVFHVLTPATENKAQVFVMPAWIAGIQVAGMSPETSMLT